MAKQNLDHRPVLDLTLRQNVHTSGDLTLFLTWYGRDRAESEPCIAIIPSYRTHGIQPAVICLSAAYQWLDGRHAARKASEFCLGLQIEPTSRNCMRLVELILAHLDELIAMPPRPTRREVVGGTAVLRDSDGGHRETEIVHNV